MGYQEELESTLEVLISKGYNGYFITNMDSIGRLKGIIDNYDGRNLWLSTYLSWNGENKPYVACDLWLSMQNGNLAVDKIIIEKKDQYGALLKRSELKDLPISSVPTFQQAIDMVNDNLQKKANIGNGRKFRM